MAAIEEDTKQVQVELVLNINHQARFTVRVDACTVDVFAKLSKLALNKWRMKYRLKRKKMRFLAEDGTLLTATLFLKRLKCRASICVFVSNGEKFAGVIPETKTETTKAVVSTKPRIIILKIVPEKALGNIFGKGGSHLYSAMVRSGVTVMKVSQRYRRKKSKMILHADVTKWLAQDREYMDVSEEEIGLTVRKTKDVLANVKSKEALLLMCGKSEELKKANQFIDEYIRKCPKFRMYVSAEVKEEEDASSDVMDDCTCAESESEYEDDESSSFQDDFEALFRYCD